MPRPQKVPVQKNAQQSEADTTPYSAYVEIKDEKEASRVRGKHGKNRALIEKASRCSVTQSSDNTYFEIRGSYENTMTAVILVRRSMNLKKGDLEVKSEDVQHNCTVLEVPREATRMVVGKGGAHLQQLEDQCETAMFFVKIIDQDIKHDTSRLAIFGGRLGRRLAQLLIMRLVETIVDGFYTKPWHDSGETFNTKADLDGDWGTTVQEMSSQTQVSWIMGQNYRVVKCLMKASGCIISAVGKLLFVSGTEEQRSYAGEYIDWRFESMDHADQHIHLRRPEDRADCNLITIPTCFIGAIIGTGRELLNGIEEDWGVLIFRLKDDPTLDEQRFVIFGQDRARYAAQFRMQELMEQHSPEYFTDSISEGRSDENGFAVDYFKMDPYEAAYVRRKEASNALINVATASNAAIHFISNVCCIAGDIDERHRAHDYIQWLMLQSRGEDLAPEASSREDITEIELSDDEVRHIIRRDLHTISTETDTYLFFTKTPAGKHGIRVCGHNSGVLYRDKGRLRAEMLVRRVLHVNMAYTRDGPDRNSDPPAPDIAPPRKTARPSHDHDCTDMRAETEITHEYGIMATSQDGTTTHPSKDGTPSNNWIYNKLIDRERLRVMEDWKGAAIIKQELLNHGVTIHGRHGGWQHEDGRSGLRPNADDAKKSEAPFHGNTSAQKIIPLSNQKKRKYADWPEEVRNTSTKSTSKQNIFPKVVQADTITRKLPQKAIQQSASVTKSQSDGPWRVFVAGMPAESTDEDLRQLCEQVLSADEILDSTVKLGKGCGWLELSSRSAGEVAIQGLHQREITGWEKPVRARWTVQASVSRQ